MELIIVIISIHQVSLLSRLIFQARQVELRGRISAKRVRNQCQGIIDKTSIRKGKRIRVN